MASRKPVAPKGMWSAPQKPLPPKETITSDSCLETIEVNTYGSIELKDLIDKYGTNLKFTLSDWDYEYEYYDRARTLSEISLSIYSSDPVPNPNYERELAKYNKALEKYKTDKALWDKYEKDLKAWEERNTILREKKLLSELKKKYEV